MAAWTVKDKRGSIIGVVRNEVWFVGGVHGWSHSFHLNVATAHPHSKSDVQFFGVESPVEAKEFDFSLRLRIALCRWAGKIRLWKIDVKEVRDRKSVV